VLFPSKHEQGLDVTNDGWIIIGELGQIYHGENGPLIK
jgi:hypothetical protein